MIVKKRKIKKAEDVRIIHNKDTSRGILVVFCYLIVPRTGLVIGRTPAVLRFYKVRIAHD